MNFEEAIKIYTGNQHKIINNPNYVDPDPDFNSYIYTIRYSIQNELEKCKLPDTVGDLYRYGTVGEMGRYLAEKALYKPYDLVGKVYQMRGFTSATSDSKYAVDQAYSFLDKTHTHDVHYISGTLQRNKPMCLNILNTAGSCCKNISKYSNSYGEKEFIFGWQQCFMIAEVCDCRDVLAVRVVAIHA